MKVTNEPENIDKPVRTEQPEIVVFLRPYAPCVQCLMLCIENVGTRTAYNIQFRSVPFATAQFSTPSSHLSDVDILKKINFIQNGIGCFGPGQKIEQFLISLIGGLPEELKQPMQISVTYMDSLNQTYENRYALDFGDFESLLSIDSEVEKLTSELRSLINVIQAGFTQVAENIERIRPPQTAGLEEHPQSAESEQVKPLSPELQEFVDLYNVGNDAKLRQIYSPFYSIQVSNESDRLQNPNVPPIFQTHSNGSFVAYAVDSENLYAVAPFSGFVLQNALYSSGAFGDVFECPGFDPEYKYRVKVIRPAFFKRDPVNEEWTLQEKGKLELKEKDY